MTSRGLKEFHGVRLSPPLTGSWRRGIGLVCLVLAAAIASLAQDGQPSPNAVGFKTLVNFDGTNGGNAMSPLVQGTDGKLYGVAGAGANGGGNVFKMTPTGSLTVLYSFCALTNCADGSGPAGLVLGTDGNFYGTTTFGGANNNSHSCVGSGTGGCGTAFKITPSGALTTIYNFCAQANCADGGLPNALVLGADGNFYGTTEGDGTSCGVCGPAFRITPQGTLTTLHNFNGTDGATLVAGLIRGTDGNLYGAAQAGGGSGDGTFFKMTPQGTLTVLHNFDGTHGLFPEVPPVQAANGDFYGTTYAGGAHNAGTVYKITPAGTFTTLYNFCAQTNCADGADAFGLLQGNDGNFYGTTVDGGTNDNCSLFQAGCGTVFKLTPGGTLTTLHNFDGTDGEFLFGGLVQRTNGTLFGTTNAGGTGTACSGGCGTVFGLNVGLGPFVETLLTSGKVGERFRILGSNLIGATGVSFNGTAAAFKVVSPSEIETTVPTGATTGFVTVTTPTGTLKSNVKFHVRP